MYYEYFGLRQAPFKITPDTRLFFPGGNRGAILEALIYAIVNGEGIVKVVGEVGTGKTMLCRMLEQELANNIEVVYLANPTLSPDQIPYAIAFELNLEVAASDNRLQVMNDLQDYLVKKHAENGQVVVFVEEAQAMSINSLEELRLLSNLETGQNKLLQIVLFGQPELDEMISKAEIRQLKERITYTFQLTAFKNDEIKEYINSRLRACGYRLDDAFDASAIKAISKYSKGLLRRINILSDKSLLAAYAANTSQVNAKHVRIAAKDSEFVKSPKVVQMLLLGLASLFLVMMFLLIASHNRFINSFSVDTLFSSKDDQAQRQATPLTKLAEKQESSALIVQNLHTYSIGKAEMKGHEGSIKMIEQIVSTTSERFIDDIPQIQQHSTVNKEDKQLLDLDIFFLFDTDHNEDLVELDRLMKKLVMEHYPENKQSSSRQEGMNWTPIFFKSVT